MGSYSRKEPEAATHEISSKTKDPERSFKEAVRHTTITLWIWELLSLLVSATCIGAITILLAHFDNKPLPAWGYGLTLNGIISILSGVAKASLVLPVAETISQLKWHWFWDRQRPIMDFERYDSASRGPWGSLVMLCNVRRWSLGALGAAITIATLAVEPCLQQLPAYPSRMVVSGTAAAARSVEYVDATNDMLGDSLKAAVYSGIFSGNGTSYTASCPTGNCTYPTHNTLGMCSACEDISPLLYSNGAGWGFSSNQNDQYFYQFDARSSRQLLLMRSWIEHDSAFPMVFTGAKNHTVLNLDLMYWSTRTYSESSPPPSASFECILYFCVKEQSAATINGQYVETTMSTWPAPNQTLPENEPYAYDNSEIQHMNETEIRKLRNYTLTPPGSDETFVVDHYTLTVLRIWMRNQLEGTSWWGGEDDSDNLPSGQDIPQAFYNALHKLDGVGGNKTIGGYVIQKNPGPGALLEQLADSMTAHMRQIANSTHAAIGTATSAQTFVQARWGWAILPITMLFMTVAYMALAVTVCSRAGMPVWKSSSLAVLLHGVDEGTAAVMSAERLPKMEANASQHDMIMHRRSKRRRLESVKK
ncbi:acid phosphatase protein [Teratosphaeria destructans]|uniref:Acid phosphatase protein n=1 Tax=Teratosphaeria destructans TaxID=418781 RepID=A0A9W7SRS3_9PEZI|nr:acid phosphatase protein [Teratosphaeria destructans]